jgi:protein-S-isoprenylcysteine O-methyltransferase Ste14
MLLGDQKKVNPAHELFMTNRLFNNSLPAIIWISYHAWIFSRREISLLTLLLIVRALVVLWCFFIREIPKQRAPLIQIMIAWISTFLPTLMIWQTSENYSSVIANVIVTLGVLLFTLACLDLGKSFGVSPALRSPVTSGVYRYINHPLYISHVILELGIFISNPTQRNAIIGIIAWGLYLLRSRWEVQLIGESKINVSKVTFLAL